ncbi:Hypothetical_protein [Hexamita inflata]|uniref:Hypothetical_protein n=1 Tax=Hexamita inflata TaxID=28002 RepID=A0AA86UVQ1_9EUKA|nr:Hypothetical protein HINF_LOCUS61335 [Hexamita inflata]
MSYIDFNIIHQELTDYFPIIILPQIYNEDFKDDSFENKEDILIYNLNQNEFILTNDNQILIDHEFINKQGSDAFNLKYSGESQDVRIFILNNLTNINKNLTCLDLKAIILDLNGVIVKANQVELSECEVFGVADYFKCDKLIVRVCEQAILWIKTEYFSNLELYFRAYQFFDAQLAHLNGLRNIQLVQFNECKVDLSLFNMTASEVIFQRCILMNNVQNMHLNTLRIDQSEFCSSQLKNAFVNNLLINQEDKNKFTFLYLNYTAFIDDLPDTYQVKVSDCELNFRTFAAPRVNIFEWSGMPRNCSFTFFKNMNDVRNNYGTLYEEYHELLQTNNKYITQQNLRQIHMQMDQIIYQENILKYSSKVKQWITQTQQIGGYE